MIYVGHYLSIFLDEIWQFWTGWRNTNELLNQLWFVCWIVLICLSVWCLFVDFEWIYLYAQMRIDDITEKKKTNSSLLFYYIIIYLHSIYTLYLIPLNILYISVFNDFWFQPNFRFDFGHMNMQLVVVLMVFLCVRMHMHVYLVLCLRMNFNLQDSHCWMENFFFQFFRVSLKSMSFVSELIMLRCCILCLWWCMFISFLGGAYVCLSVWY